MTDGELWSFFRDLISQGTYIQMDYAAGKYKCYEEFSARLDCAARERLDQWRVSRAAQETAVAHPRCVCGRAYEYHYPLPSNGACNGYRPSLNR